MVSYSSNSTTSAMRTYVYTFILIVIFKQCTCYLGEIGGKQIGPLQMWNETMLDKLKKDLFINYDTHARPQQHYNVTDVRLGMSVWHLTTNELRSTVTISGVLKLVWTDSKLKWKETDYDGISAARIAEHEVWQPDIFLYNSVFGGTPVPKVNAPNVLLYSDGEVLWVPSFEYTALCKFDLRHWPFDTQQCCLKFGSWTHNGNEISLTLYNDDQTVATDSYLTRTWNISNSSVEIISKMYDCCSEPYHEIWFNLTLVRNYKPYTSLIVTPAAVIALLILVQFWLPPRAEERMILNCLVSTVILMFLLYFANHISAAGSNTPLIVIFYATCLSMQCLTMAANVLFFSLFKVTRVGSLTWIVNKYLIRGNLKKFLLLNYYFEENSLPSENQQNKNDQNLQSSSSIAPPYKQNACTWKYNEQEILALAMDRICFVICSVVYILLGFIYLL